MVRPAIPDHAPSARVELAAANGNPRRPDGLRPMHWALLGLSLAVSVALVILSAASRGAALFLYGRVSYWLILILLLAWVAEVARYLIAQRFDFRAFARDNWIGLAAALAVTLIAVLSVRPQFRVLSDEANLMAVSQSMLYHKTTYNSTEQKRYYGWMNPLNFEVEKRPLVFPFLVQVVHMARGYSAGNAFVLNRVALFVLLGMIAVVAGRTLRAPATVAAIVLVGAYPLVVSSATSAGFDLLATVFTGLGFALAYFHMQAPSGSRFALLFSTLLVLAQVRYECAIYVAIICGLLAAFGYVRKEFLCDHLHVYCLAPLVLLPLWFQRVLNPAPHENPPGVAPFGWEHVKRLGAIFLRAQGDMEFLLPHAPLLYWIAGPILVFLGIRLLQGRLGLAWRGKGQFLLLVFVAFVANYGIVFSFHGSNFTHPGAVRYFINMSVLVALLPVFLHVAVPALLTAPRLLLFAVGVALVYHPISVQGKFTMVQTQVRESEIEWNFLQRYNDPNILVIVDRPGHFTIWNYGAVSFNYANKNPDMLLFELRRHLYTEILVFQKITYGTPDVATADHLHPKFRLEKLMELQSSANEFVRISKVVP